MARRNKKNESLADALFQAPWQISVVIGVVVFIALKFVFPSIWSGNLFLKPMAQAFSQLAWLFSGFFFLIVAFVYFKSAALRSKQSSTIFRETLSGDCVFHAIWTLIPRQTGHAFQSKLDSRSVATRGFGVLL